jgi:hypothetical protein
MGNNAVPAVMTEHQPGARDDTVPAVVIEPESPGRDDTVPAVILDPESLRVPAMCHGYGRL